MHARLILLEEKLIFWELGLSFFRGPRRKEVGGSLNNNRHFVFDILGKVKKFQINRYMRLGAMLC